MMIRTQIYIGENTHRTISQIAAEQGLSMAAIIRRFIRQGLEKSMRNKQNSHQIMKNIANLKIVGGPSDLSKNLDHYLYGSSENGQ